MFRSLESGCFSCSLLPFQDINDMLAGKNPEQEKIPAPFDAVAKFDSCIRYEYAAKFRDGSVPADGRVFIAHSPSTNTKVPYYGWHIGY